MLPLSHIPLTYPHGRRNLTLEEEPNENIFKRGSMAWD